MSLAAGVKLGPYELVAPTGKGGMGEVYRATDPRLHREVAIKISAERLTAPMEGNSDHPGFGKAEPFLHTSSSAMEPVFSPDGRWLAYSSDETGTYDVYVRPFPGPGGRSQISTGGGQRPIWSRNGRELFFLAPDLRIMVAGYTGRGNSFAAGKPQVWSERRLLEIASSATSPVDGTYDLAPDGKRFALVLSSGGTAEPEQKPIDSVTVLLNFFDELKRRIPVSR